MAGALAGLGALAAGVNECFPYPVHAAQGGFDAALLALIAEAEAINREDDRLWDACADLPGKAPESEAWHDYIDATRPRWRVLIAQIRDTPARTPEGMRAKARYALALVPEDQRDGPNPCDEVAWAVLRELVGRTGA